MKMVNKIRAVWTARALERQFCSPPQCPVGGGSCVRANSTSDGSTRGGGHSPTGSGQALVQHGARWSCRDSCSSAELLDRNQRGHSLVTNQSATRNTGFFQSLGPSLILLAFSPLRNTFIKICILIPLQPGFTFQFGYFITVVKTLIGDNRIL